MARKHHRQSETVRLTIDIPKRQHTYIKALAADKGVSLRQFVIAYLPDVPDKEKFNKIVEEFLVEHDHALRKLADS